MFNPQDNHRAYHSPNFIGDSQKHMEMRLFFQLFTSRNLYIWHSKSVCWILKFFTNENCKTKLQQFYRIEFKNGKLSNCSGETYTILSKANITNNNNPLQNIFWYDVKIYTSSKSTLHTHHKNTSSKPILMDVLQSIPDNYFSKVSGS